MFDLGDTILKFSIEVKSKCEVKGWRSMLDLGDTTLKFSIEV